MAKQKLKLTWQKGADGRSGRWKKVIRGVTYYFDGGNGKSDRKSYKSALEEVDRIKSDLVSNAKKTHEDEYEIAIREWESVRNFCANSEKYDEILQVADRKLKELQRRIAGARPRKLSVKDYFLGYLIDPIASGGESRNDSVPHRPPRRKKRGKDKAWMEAAFASINLGAPDFNLHEIFQPTVPFESIEQVRKYVAGQVQAANDPRVIEFALWLDRIENLNLAPEAKALGSHARAFVELQRQRAERRDISVGRYDNLRRNVGIFVEITGQGLSIDELNEKVLRQFYQAVVRKVEAGDASPSTGRDSIADANQFVRWLYREGAIEQLPRNIGGQEITVPASQIQVFSRAEVGHLLRTAKGRSRLYILLALNCGMTQIDIADLAQDEVDWKAGVIRRKRSKTSKFESTPTVEYHLWPETLDLLKGFRSKGERVLLNKYGKPLRQEIIRSDGKRKKTDAIGREFSRLKVASGVTGPSFIGLKKTGRSLLEDNRHYQPIAELYVGRAPRTVSERHYAAPPITWLAEATDWLRNELKIKKYLDGPKRRKAK